MFGILRLIIMILVFTVLALLLKRFVRMTPAKNCLLFIGVGLLTLALTFVHFENLFVTFSSPQAAYRYYYVDREPTLVVEGENSDLVVGIKASTTTPLIVPKAEGGWKVGTFWGTRKVAEVLDQSGTIVTVYQHQGTGDCFVIVAPALKERTPVVTDNHGSTFHPLLLTEGWSPVYYAHLSSFEEGYAVNVDGTGIMIPG